VSVVFFEPPGDHRGDVFFMEKTKEAKVAIDRVRRLYESSV